MIIRKKQKQKTETVRKNSYESKRKEGLRKGYTEEAMWGIGEGKCERERERGRERERENESNLT